MEESYIEFNRTKLRDVVLYVCDNCNPSELGNVKLHKILYFSDMLMFMHSGKPLTGVDYIKQQFGPTARHLTSVVNELASSGALKVETRSYFGFEKKAYIALSKPAAGALGNDEIEIISDVIDFVCARSAREISELCHDLAWQMADMGERIPYAAVYGFQPAEITDEDRAAAVSEARKIRPMIEREHDAGRVF